MRYYWKGKFRKGYINIANPFRGTWVVGTSSSGKTFSVIELFIRQHSKKGFAMVVYGYKWPTLAQKLYYAYCLNKKTDDDNDGAGDRLDGIYGSVEIDFSNLNYQDALTILNQIPNKRYSSLIRLRYLEQKTNEETAEALGMTMDNYYNKHKLAKEQYLRVYRKEVIHG